MAEDLFNNYIKNTGIKVLYGYRIKNAVKENGFIEEIELESTENASLPATTMISAKMFIDCSYEGDLMAKSGISYTVGREANSSVQ